MKKVAIRIFTLKKNFGPTRALEIEQSRDNPVTIYRGCTTAVLGLSGSGKSTLLNILNLLETPDEGVNVEYYPEGTDIPIHYGNLSTSQKVELRNKEFGVAFQDGHLIGHISVADNVRLPMSLAGANSEGVSVVSSSIIEGLGLTHRSKSRPKELSGGEYQRVAVARAMSHNPKIIFCDEPTGNLDTDTGRIVMDMLDSWRDQNESNTLILVTHDIHEAVAHADEFIILYDGQVKCSFSKEELNTARKGAWREIAEVDPDATGYNAISSLFDTSKEESEKFEYPSWDRKISLFRKGVFLFKYGLRDLFPISFSSWSVFKTTIRDTIFSILTTFSISVLVSVLLIGYGIYFGVTKYQIDAQQRDIRANRLIVEIQPDSDVESITDEVLAELREDLGEIYIQKKNLLGFPTKQKLPAVQGVYGYTNSELFIYNKDVYTTIATRGTTVDPNSPLLDRITLNGEKIEGRLILSDSTEGIILKKKWLNRLNYDEDNPPENIIFNYSGREEELPILGLVDELPDGLFLISAACWHQIRDRKWRPNYKIGVLSFSKKIDIISLIPQLKSALKGFINPADQKGMKIEPDTSSSTEDKLYFLSGHDLGWNKRYWNKAIYKGRIEPFLQKNGITAGDFNLTVPIKSTPISGSLDYLNAAVYLSEYGAVTKVAKAIRDNPAKLGVDPYLESAYKWLHQTDQLLRLIFASIAICVFILCLVNIFLMFYQTVLRKRHEIGILKAFGSTKKRISSIFFIESLYLWLFGSLLGLVLGIYGGEFSANALKSIYELQLSEGELFQLDWNVLFIFISVFIVCEVITFTATYSHAKKTASELLRQRG